MSVKKFVVNEIFVYECFTLGEQGFLTDVSYFVIFAINYAQLSKDLQAHIDSHKQREQQAKTTPVTPLPTAATPSIATAQEKRDQHINNAVHAKRFSNEGAWLTQLLESVDGSIPRALDLMSGIGRNAT